MASLAILASGGVGAEGFLPPDAFTNIPAHVRAAMADLGCRVPQAYFVKEPHNVISGAFGAADQRDWAFLCSANGMTRLHVLWGGPARCPPFQEAARTDASQQDADSPGYSTAIATVSPAAIRKRYSDYGYGKAPDVDHDGIDVGFDERASIVHYCNAGVWQELLGSD